MKVHIFPENTSVLVTGGAGFIGSDFVRTIDSYSSVRQIYVLDSFTYAADVRRLEGVSNKVEIINANLLDVSKYKNVLGECQFVIHMAAESHVDRSISSGHVFVESNILGSYELFEQCRIHPQLSLVHVSTDEVYGSRTIGESIETDVLKPTSAYSASKAASDLLALANFATHRQKIAITRCTNNFGPFQNSEKFLPTVINNALQGKPIPIYGNGLNQREWIHVSDHNQAVLRVLANFTAGEIFNIGSGVRLTNLEIAKQVLSVLDVNYTNLQFVEDRKGHDFRYALNSSKIRKQIDWDSQLDFFTGLRSTIEWYRNWFIENGECYS